MLRVSCPYCGATYTVAVDVIGTDVECASCHHPFRAELKRVSEKPPETLAGPADHRDAAPSRETSPKGPRRAPTPNVAWIFLGPGYFGALVGAAVLIVTYAKMGLFGLALSSVMGFWLLLGSAFLLTCGHVICYLAETAYNTYALRCELQDALEKMSQK